jgi:uncharacterized membrane protein YgcG
MDAKEAQRKFEQFSRWLSRSYTNLGIVMAPIVAIGLLGFWLAFIMPGQVTASAMATAQSTHDNARGQLQTAYDRYKSEAKWYREGHGYIDGMYDTLVNSQNDILASAAKRAEADAVSLDPDEKLSLAKEATKLANDALGLINGVTTKLDQNKRLKAQTFENHAKADKERKQMDATVNAVETRFGNEAGSYLAKYTDTYATDLQTSKDHQGQASNYFATASFFLPSNEDVGNGDPNEAQRNLDLMSTSAASAIEFAGKVTTGLDYQALAKSSAQPSTTQAKDQYDTAIVHTNNIKQQRQYWLTTSGGFLVQSLAKLTEAQTALAAAPPLDYPVAFEAAKSSLTLSKQAITRANDEVAAADAAAQTIGRIDTRVGEVNDHITRAQAARDTLAANHAQDTWSDVSDFVNQAIGMVNQARQFQADARAFIAITVQEFFKGKESADAGITSLAKADELASAVETRRNDLEAVRAQWPTCRATANSKISNSQGTVERYSGYSSSAVNDFNAAVSLFNTAQSRANSGHYAQACADASAAGTAAVNAANKAERAYDDEMDRQRRQREAEAAAERARQQAAEDAARRQRDSSSSSGASGGYSGGGYSSGGSDSYSSGGGSDSDYGGGGSDSDY